MTDQEILILASDYAVTDDFGYTVFRSDDDLLNFVDEILLIHGKEANEM